MDEKRRDLEAWGREKDSANWTPIKGIKEVEIIFTEPIKLPPPPTPPPPPPPPTPPTPEPCMEFHVFGIDAEENYVCELIRCTPSAPGISKTIFRTVFDPIWSLMNAKEVKSE